MSTHTLCMATFEIIRECFHFSSSLRGPEVLSCLLCAASVCSGSFPQSMESCKVANHTSCIHMHMEGFMQDFWLGGGGGGGGGGSFLALMTIFIARTL